MGTRSYQFSEGTEESLKDAQIKIQSLLNLPEPPPIKFVAGIILGLGFSVFHKASDHPDPASQLLPSGRNFKDFLSMMYSQYQQYQNEKRPQ